MPPQTAVGQLGAGAALQVGGTVGSLLLCLEVAAAGALRSHIAILFVIAVPVVGSIGYAGTEPRPAR